MFPLENLETSFTTTLVVSSIPSELLFSHAYLREERDFFASSKVRIYSKVDGRTLLGINIQVRTAEERQSKKKLR